MLQPDKMIDQDGFESPLDPSLSPTGLPSPIELSEADSSGEELAEGDTARTKEEQNDLDEAIIFSLVEQLRISEENSRNLMLRESKQLDAYYQGFQHNFWNARTSTWQRSEDAYLDPRLKTVPARLKKTFNNFQGWLDSIIAALSVSIPNTIFFPTDADNPDDIEAAEAYTRASELIAKWNDAAVLLPEALYIMSTQHLLAFYNYYRESNEYGTYKTPIMEDVQHDQEVPVCTTCGSETESPDPQTGMAMCPGCKDMSPTETQSVPFTENEKVGEVDNPVERECLEVYGDINIRIPINCKHQRDAHYLIFEREFDIATLKEEFPHIADKITPLGDYSPYEIWARRDACWTDNLEIDQATRRMIWLRPAAFNLLEDSDNAEFRERFPDGCRAIFVGNILADIRPEKFDEHWTLAKSPTNKYLHFKPIGRDLIPVQDAINTVFNLTEETVKHGITEMFADQRILDFDMYSKSSAQPGQTYPIKNRLPDQDLGKAFYERKPAVLGREVDLYQLKLTEVGQFIGGVYPSIFGGVIQGGSQTGKEYELSRAAALQRLTLKWKTITTIFPRAIRTACNDLFANLKRDVSFAKKSGGGFINVWIKKESAQGTVSHVESDASEEFPMSWAQKQERLFMLVNTKTPQLDAAIYDPTNLSFTAKLLGFPEANIPGEKDRQKQLFEIQLLLRNQPVPPPPPPVDPATGQPMPQIDQMTGKPIPPPPATSSLPPDQFDDHNIHGSIARNFLISSEGLALRDKNPNGYQNVVAHWLEHTQAAAMQAAATAQAQNSQAGSGPVEDVPA